MVPVLKRVTWATSGDLSPNPIISVPFRALVCLPGFLLFSFSLNRRLTSFSKTPLKRLPGDAAVVWSLAKDLALAVEGTWVLTDFEQPVINITEL